MGSKNYKKIFLIRIKYKINEVIKLMDYARWTTHLAHGVIV